MPESLDKNQDLAKRADCSTSDRSDTSQTAGAGAKSGESGAEAGLQLLNEREESKEAATVASADQPDYTTREELIKLVGKHPVAQNHTVVNEMCLQLSVADFFKKILTDGSPISLETTYRERGEQQVRSVEWQPAADGETHEGLPVLETKVYELEVQIKGNPFVKKAPTKRTMKLI